ncbi:MAG: acetate--CoA ligase [Chitinophagaceae bacterium]
MSYPYQIKSLEQYQKEYKKSVEDPVQFWSEIAAHFIWKKKYTQVLSWNFSEPKVSWFEDGELNITENCIDRWAALQPNTVAMIWESNDPDEDSIHITYKELLIKVCQFAQVLKNKGVRKGDRICLYMPMVPELAIALLACARIGAIHSVIFGGFSAQSIVDRINDASCSMVITADGTYRGNKLIPLKEIIDEALPHTLHVKNVIVLQRAKNSIHMLATRDSWWHQEMDLVKEITFIEATPMKAEDPLFILYTSGSTGKPKGVLHTCAGYMIYANYTFINVFQYQPSDIHFCTADIGWITGHSYIVYGPLSAGATTLLFDGIPTWPNAGRLWEIVDKHQVNILYTAPTAIRSLMTFGTTWIQDKKLCSLKVLGSVGEPINEEAWHWFDEHIGKGKCPIVDTWWQTETGGIMISNLAGITPQKPTYATLPLPGIQAVLVNEEGHIIEGSDATGILSQDLVSGNLCIKFPWPGMIRTTYGDHERCRISYFSTYKDLYFTGDGCFRDSDGHYRITGRVDDVLNVSGHRIGTAEVENAINLHGQVIESAVVGYPHDIKGQGLYAFVIVNQSSMNTASLLQEINQSVVKHIGAIARPDKIQMVKGLPKTRSGKIMRRILRKIAEGDIENIGDTTTLLDPSVVDDIIKGVV